jgi:ABC-type polysaccharide/polyol phosphate transport system ATPase subunit
LNRPLPGVERALPNSIYIPIAWLIHAYEQEFSVARQSDATTGTTPARRLTANKPSERAEVRVRRECWPSGLDEGGLGNFASGKSTLLKMLAGIYRADEGSVSVRGKLSPFIELGVGFNPELTGRDNVRVNGTLLGLSKRELARRFDDIVAFAELERFIDQKLKNYSSGMQVRLAYSIAIQVDFDVLLLDEVLAVGDRVFQEKCLETFEAIRSAGKTIVFVSHQLDAVREVCDRVLLMESGRAEAIGSADEVIDHYRRSPARIAPAAA